MRANSDNWQKQNYKQSKRATLVACMKEWRAPLFGLVVVSAKPQIAFKSLVHVR
jgi:hypothetical protein